MTLHALDYVEVSIWFSMMRELETLMCFLSHVLFYRGHLGWTLMIFVPPLPFLSAQQTHTLHPMEQPCTFFLFTPSQNMPRFFKVTAPLCGQNSKQVSQNGRRQNLPFLSPDHNLSWRGTTSENVSVHDNGCEKLQSSFSLCKGGCTGLSLRSSNPHLQSRACNS